MNYKQTYNKNKHKHKQTYNKKALTTTIDERFKTVYELLEETLKTMGEKNFLGMRKQLDNKKWGPYEWESFKTIGDRRTNFGSGLINICG